jgi:hypothetical protein
MCREMADFVALGVVGRLAAALSLEANLEAGTTVLYQLLIEVDHGAE